MSRTPSDQIRQIRINGWRADLRRQRYDTNRIGETLADFIRGVMAAQDSFDPDEWMAFTRLVEDVEAYLALHGEDDQAQVAQIVVDFFQAALEIDRVVELGHDILRRGVVRRSGAGQPKGIDLSVLDEVQPRFRPQLSMSVMPDDWEAYTGDRGAGRQYADTRESSGALPGDDEPRVQHQNATPPEWATELESTGPEESAPPPVDVTYQTRVDFPRQIEPTDSRAHPLIVQLTLQRAEQSRVQGEVTVSFANPQEPELLQVKITALGFDEVTGCWHRTLAVYPGQDSQPAVFLLQLADPTPQERQITVDFYHQGRNIGSFTFQVGIGDWGLGTRDWGLWTGEQGAELGELGSGTGEQGGTRSPIPNPQSPIPVTGSALPLRAVSGLRIPVGRHSPVDVELRITRPAADLLSFTLHSGKGYGNYHWRDMGVQRFTDVNRPEAFMEKQFERLNQLARKSLDRLEDWEAEDIKIELENLGQDLYNQLFPDKLKQEYWKLLALRDELRQQRGQEMTLLITSDEPWIPWEMVRPYQDGQPESGFLAQEFQLSRWLAGQGPLPGIVIRAAQLVAPRLDLTFVEDERRLFESLAGLGVNVPEPIRSRREFRQMASAGGVEIVHFATHADFDRETPNESPITLEDGPLLPRDVNRRVAAGLASSRPIFFVNSCHGGRMGLELTGPGGWAQQMVDEFGVMAFIGTHWEIHDELAALFSQRFYTALQEEGSTLGSAFHTARMAIRQRQPANPTWLAYVLYGDPNSRVTWGAGR